MAGCNSCKERGPVGQVDYKVLQNNQVTMVESLDALKLINELFQNAVIDQEDMNIISKKHAKGKKQGVEQMLEIIRQSGSNAFSGFIKSLRMAKYTKMADKLDKEHKLKMLQQDETETQEPKTGNVRRDEEMKGLTEKVQFLKRRSNKLSDKFDFAKLPPFPRINTDGINTDGINTDVIKTVEDIIERCEDWKRKIEVWLKNRDDCLDKLLKWWEGKQYEDVDIFKRDVKEWRDVLYKYLVSEVELLDSLIKWIQFVVCRPDWLYVRLYYRLRDSLHVRLYVSLHDGLLWKSKDDLYTLVGVYKQRQDKVKVETEQCINRLNQIISDEGKDNTGASSKDNTGASSKDNTGASKDNTGRSKDNTGASIDNELYVRFCVYFAYTVDLTSTQTNIGRIYKHLKL